uniref:Secreted protein n=1 Tax=Ascaris lumbricoides TaxID=6252 RepID=A0A0M3IMZ8_ASCLU
MSTTVLIAALFGYSRFFFRQFCEAAELLEQRSCDGASSIPNSMEATKPRGYLWKFVSHFYFEHSANHSSSWSSGRARSDSKFHRRGEAARGVLISLNSTQNFCNSAKQPSCWSSEAAMAPALFRIPWKRRSREVTSGSFFHTFILNIVRIIRARGVAIVPGPIPNSIEGAKPPG